jgi:hypothetical protein
MGLSHGLPLQGPQGVPGPQGAKGDPGDDLAGSSEWANIQNKPASFPPEAHNHDWAAVQNKPLTFPADVSSAWPVGSVFTSVVATNPATLLGFGTWSAFAAGRVLVGLDSGQTEFDTVKETGGAKTHTLQVSEIPSHTHVQTQNSVATGGLVGYAARDTSTNTQSATGYSTEATGGGGAHNNLQPYIVVHFWERTA